ncbi:MAG: hypothetical protein IKE41_01575, partial [Clostridia bacterium]|nr:hypothetical protein [Clostridia bacterium]MBR2735352.1 hypothetical protein [Clostridia bacterium]
MKNIKNIGFLRNIKGISKNITARIHSNPKLKNTISEIKRITIILLSVFFILTLWANRINLYPENILLWAENSVKSFSLRNHFPVQIQGEKIMTENLALNNGYLVALSDSYFNVLTKKGKLIQSEKHNFSNPNLKSAGLRHIIFDRGGKNFKISSNTRTLYSAETEHGIITASIANDGSYTVVTQSPRYLAEIHVYDRNNTLKFKVPISEYYITNVEMNSSSSEIALSGISAYNGDIISNIYIVDNASQTIKSQFELPDNMVTDIKYFANGTIVAIGDKYSAFINPKTKSVIKKDYENKILKFYDFDKSGTFCICISSSANESSRDTLLKLDEHAEETLKIETDQSFRDIILK